jgi:hypothetical protein
MNKTKESGQPSRAEIMLGRNSEPRSDGQYVRKKVLEQHHCIELVETATPADVVGIFHQDKEGEVLPLKSKASMRRYKAALQILSEYRDTNQPDLVDIIDAHRGRNLSWWTDRARGLALHAAMAYPISGLTITSDRFVVDDDISHGHKPMLLP